MEKVKEGEIKSKGEALEFEVIGKWNRARVSKLTLPHHSLQTPIFMPVGTQGTVKGLTSNQIEDLQCDIILGNTYHLGHRPGADVVEEANGLHNFMHWPRNMLTDSGGFQMVSLLELATITEEGVKFISPHNGTEMMLTPEESMAVQNSLGADIMMALDDVCATTTEGPRVEEAMERTLRWIDRCISAHKNTSRQNLFGIVQGGLDINLRDRCIEGLIKRDLPGYAIGGLSGGEEKAKFWRIVAHSAKKLPENKPRYLMGVGYPLDMVVCVALGVDMFDCVYPSRTARFGTALVPTGTMSLKSSQYKNDFRPIDEDCSCMTCKRYSRAFIHNIAGKQPLSAQIITYHNIAYQMRLMKEMRESIMDGSFPEYVKVFMQKRFPKGDYPTWVVDALAEASIIL